MPAVYYTGGGGGHSHPGAQQGVYYQGGQYVGPTGATGALPTGTTPSALPGSVPTGGGVQKPGTTEPQQTYQPPSEAVLAKPTATQTLGQPPTTIGYQTIGGKTYTTAPPSYTNLLQNPFSPAFQEKYAAGPPTPPQAQQAFFYKQGPTTITPEGIAQTVFEPVVQPKEYGGMIAPLKPTISEWGELRKTYGTWATTKLFESKMITPKIQEFFGTTKAQREAEPLLEAAKPKSQLMQAYDYFFGKPGSFGLNLVYGKPKLGAKPPVFSATAGKTFSEGMKQGYYGAVNEFISKPVTKVAPSLIIGAGFGAGFTAAENVILRGMVASKPLLEAVTSPAGQLAYKGVQYGLMGAYVGAEALQVAKSPTRAYTAGEKLFEVPTVFAGARVGARATGLITESEFVRRSRWGSPERRIAEVVGIKKITPESMSKAFETSETPYRAELKSMSAEQVKTELREASDVVWNLRGKYKPEVEVITPKLIQERLGISKPKAERAFELLETYTPALKGSFVAGLQLESMRGSRDIDPNLKDVAGFESAARKKGVSELFDVHEMSKFAESSTAQLEPLRTAKLVRKAPSEGKPIRLKIIEGDLGHTAVKPIFKEGDYVELYHGTPTKAGYESILKEGIVQKPSNYFKDFTEPFISTATDKGIAEVYAGDKGKVVTIRIPKSEFRKMWTKTVFQDPYSTGEGNLAFEKPIKKEWVVGSVGKELKITGPVEQLSRKVEGSIRFFNVEPKGASRAKDFPDVLAMRKSIEKGERVLPKPKEAELFKVKDLLKPSKIVPRVGVKSESFGLRKSIAPSKMPSLDLGLPSTYKMPGKTSYPSSRGRNIPSSIIPSSISKGSPLIPSPSISKPPSSPYKPSPSLTRSYTYQPSKSYYYPGPSRSASYSYDISRPPPSFMKKLGEGGTGDFGELFEKPKGKKDIYTASLVALGLNLRAPRGRVRKSLLTPFGIRPILA